MAGKPHTQRRQLNSWHGSSTGGSKESTVTAARLYGLGTDQVHADPDERARTCERTIPHPFGFVSHAVVGGVIRGDRSFGVMGGVCLRGSPHSIAAPQTVRDVRSLARLDDRRSRLNDRGSRLRRARLARTLRLHERSGVEILSALACGVPRANGANLDTVSIERPRNVFHVPGEVRPKERTNELAATLTTDLAEKLLGEIVRRDGLTRTCHTENVSHRERSFNAKFAMWALIRSIVRMTNANARQKLDNVVTNDNADVVMSDNTPPVYPHRDIDAVRIQNRLEPILWAPFEASAC